MRHLRLDRLMAGSALAALLVAAPALAQQPTIRRESGSIIMSIPQRASTARAQATTEDDAPPSAPVMDRRLPPPISAPIPPAPAATMAPPPAPAPVQAAAPLPDNRSALDKIFNASDTQISEKLRGLRGLMESRIQNSNDRKAIEAAYASQNFAPMWIKDGTLTERAKTVIERLRDVEADGFEVADYPVPDFGTFNNAEALAEGDIKLTSSVVTYARHLQSGRVAPTRVTAEADYGIGAAPADPAEILKRISGTPNINAALDHYNPTHPGFRALKAKLAEVRARAGNDTTTYIPDGGFIKLGQKDPRIPAIREKLGVAGKPDDTTYDAKLFAAVKSFQKSKDLNAGGVIGNTTIAAMNGPKANEQLAAVIGTMERWRWLPRDLGKSYVMINIPDYTLRVMNNGSLVWKTKIVVGKPQTPTPLLTAAMDHVLVNPSWYVPQSIIQNELLPQYAKDPQIFDRMGLEVRKGPDGNINVVQPPGAANALGHIKFAFPNKYQVYLHDTPERGLFAADERAFSHGCMRVEDPTKFGEVILSMAMAGPQPDKRQLDAMYGKEEKQFKLLNRPMVHLTYQTAYVDDAGKLVVRKDIYGYDTRIHAILSTDERKIADVAPPQDKQRDLATAKSNQEVLRRVERREAKNPFEFFERIFR
jgi:murein L,D-transpeptidase YcbB/YkuD